MPFTILAASATVTLLDGVTNIGRDLMVTVLPQDAGSGLDLKWLDLSTGGTEMKRRQMTANASGDPWTIGPWAWFVPAVVSFTVTNRSAGASVYVQWGIHYSVPVPVPPT